MYCLLDSFIKPSGKVTFSGKVLNRFEIYFPNKVREYYVQEEEDYNHWIEHLNKATGNVNITMKYIVNETMNIGKFGVIKEVIERKTEEKYCMKVVNKRKMKVKNFGNYVKYEEEVMRICQHPNIVRLYDVFENEDSKYLGK